MKQLVVAVTLLLAVSTKGLSAASEDSNHTKIADAYQRVHEHVCSDVGVAPCPPTLSDDEKWAFVMTWCARRPPGAAEAICADVPTSGGPVVIGFDHDARAWRTIYGVDDGDIKRDANGVPRVLTSSGRTVIAVVESTNPLAYKAEAGAITETDAEVVASIKALFGKLGPALAASAQAETGVLPTDGAAILAAQKAAKKISECTTDQWTAGRDFTQAVEDRRDATYTLKPDCPTEPSLLDPLFQQLKEKSDALSKINFCAADVAKLVAWLDMSPLNVKALRDKQKEISLGVDCEQRLAELKKGIDERLARLEEADDASREAMQQEWREGSVADRRKLDQLSALTRAASEAVAAAAALSTKERRAELETMIATIKKFDKRLEESAATTRAITDRALKTADIADFFVVRQGTVEVAWTKNRSRTLTVTKATPYEKLSTSRPDSVATSYGAGSLAASLVDMNVALVYTPLTSPVFGVVNEPAPTAADPNAKMKVIAQTDEESRSGKLAVMVSLPVFLPLGQSPWTRRFGLELGAGTSTSTPALFLGFTGRLNGGVRLGVGVTRQQVKALKGQSLGDPITSADDIKKRNAWGNDFYASFSLSLETIGGLFKAE